MILPGGARYVNVPKTLGVFGPVSYPILYSLALSDRPRKEEKKIKRYKTSPQTVMSTKAIGVQRGLSVNSAHAGYSVSFLMIIGRGIRSACTLNTEGGWPRSPCGGAAVARGSQLVVVGLRLLLRGLPKP